jgi:hypothetical protein
MKRTTTKPRPYVFRILDWNQDPLCGAYGLRWFERRYSSLTQDERQKVIDAVRDGRISSDEYMNWQDIEERS